MPSDRRERSAIPRHEYRRSQPRPLNIHTFPRPTDVSAEAVYNFFVPNERSAEDTGNRFVGARALADDQRVEENERYRIFRDKNGRKVHEFNMKGELPRYIKLDFLPPNTPFSNAEPMNPNDLKNLNDRGMFNSPERTLSAFDVFFTFIDLNFKKRIIRKTDLLARLTHDEQMGFELFSDLRDPDNLEEYNFFDNWTRIYNSLDEMYEVKNGENQTQSLKQRYNNIINFNETPNYEEVNVIEKAGENQDEFSSAQSMLVSLVVDKRFIGETIDSNIKKDSLYKKILAHRVGSEIFDLNMDLRPNSNDNSLKTLTFQGLSGQLSENTTDNIKVEIVGYKIERYENAETITSNEPEFVFYTGAAGAGSIIDPSVKYGKTYTYAIRSIYRLTILENLARPGNSTRVSQTYFTSHPSVPVFAKIEDREPPNEPDGIFYRVNYKRRKGLCLTWQYPRGTKRDVKYYQIFRRASVNEPFQCIGEIDFDNSEDRHVRREIVREDRIVRVNDHLSFFEDREFELDSSYIYAIASVDAHGLTSQYSVQTRVSFNRSNNELVLKTISRAGAPKQYPNFFIDPDEDRNVFVNALTQDTIKSSNFSNLVVYFDPDAMRYRESADAGAGVTKDAFAVKVSETESPLPDGAPELTGGVYKMLLVNTDRQKSKVLEIQIEDARRSDIFEGIEHGFSPLGPTIT